MKANDPDKQLFRDMQEAPDKYSDQEIEAKVILDTLSSESASLTYEQSNMLYQGVSADYSHILSRKKRYDAVREDPFFNALQLKHAEAITINHFATSASGTDAKTETYKSSKVESF